MQVQNINSTTFNGGFKLFSVSKDVRRELDTIAKRGKQIFDNYDRNGDVFIVVRDNLDKKVADVIERRKLRFWYYPEINTNCGLDSEKPELLRALCAKSVPHKGDIKEVLKEAVSERARLKSSKRIKSRTEMIFDLLNIKMDKSAKICKNGVQKFNDRSNNIVVTISPKSADGISYVLVENLKSTSTMESGKRYSVKSDGTIEKTYNTVNELIDFRKKFLSTLAK